MFALTKPIALALTLAALAVAGCGSDDESRASATTSSSNSSSPASSSGSGSTVTMTDNAFEPKVVRGAPGKKVTLQLRNDGRSEHDFVVDDQQVDQDVEPGETAQVDVTIPDSGKVAFYCSYHKALGMTGTLEAK